MKHTDIPALIERFLDADTTQDEERLLYQYFLQPDIDEELMPYRQMFLDYAAVEGINQETAREEPLANATSTPRWLTALRIVSTTAAAVLVGWFFYVYEETLATPKTEAKAAPPVEETSPCLTGTLHERYICYMEHHAPQVTTYQQLKQMKYEVE